MAESYLPIEQCLGQIENAVYGREVRKAIHDGIAQCYADTVRGVNEASAAASAAHEATEESLRITTASVAIASEASKVNVEHTKTGQTITITTTNRKGAKVTTTIQEPTAKIEKDESGYYRLTVADANGVTTATLIEDPGIEVRKVREELEKLTAESTGEVKRYGASGWAQSNPTLTRLYDAVGMTAMVGTDAPNPDYRNDFDDVPLFARRKCVGHWEAGDGKAVFVRQAYEGDPDYAEDGSMGDYVAVECLPAYYWESADKDVRIVSAFKLPGYRPFAILESERGSGICRPRTYLPCYALALDESGHAVSRPGYRNRQGSYGSLLADAKTYANADVKTYAVLTLDEVMFYEETLFGIEFATRHSQSVMNGVCNLLYDNATDCAKKDDTHFIVSKWSAAYVPGSDIAINATSTALSYDNAIYATHKIVSAVRCDETGNANSTGSYTLLEVEPYSDAPSYDTATTYHVTHRAWHTGGAAAVTAPSGSPVSNTSGYYPMRYRHRENVYGNQWQTTMNLFNARVGTGDDDYTLDWYVLDDATSYQSGNPNSLIGTDARWKKLRVTTAHEDYKNGYIGRQDSDPEYPELRIPVVGGASASTYTTDHAYLVITPAVRSVRVGGSWSYGAYDGFSALYGSHYPSSAYAIYGSGLYFVQ